MAASLHHFGLRTLGVCRTMPSPSAVSPHIDEYRSIGDLPNVLKESDYVVSILPNTPQTTDFFGGEMLKNCVEKVDWNWLINLSINKQQTIFINVGRGNVISNEDLTHAANQGWIGGAHIDVVRDEPLASESPLWNARNVYWFINQSINKSDSGNHHPARLCNDSTRTCSWCVLGQFGQIHERRTAQVQSRLGEYVLN